MHYNKLPCKFSNKARKESFSKEMVTKSAASCKIYLHIS